MRSITAAYGAGKKAETWKVTQFDHRNARSVPENTGRNGRAKTTLCCWWQVL
jgi:hypothetical protein